MPFTPYHFGPNGFVGLVFKRWLDLPAFVLVNVAIDVEVLLRIKHTTGPLTHWNFAHQVFHFHTLLVGGIVGAAFGLALFPFRKIFIKIMNFLRLGYKPTALKMALSGLLGAWFHVTIDGIYHRDVQMFWPNKNYRPLWNLLSKPQVRNICLVFILAAIALYFLLLVLALRKRHSLGQNQITRKQ
jgi:membrane-bound metal-dependent hydrolase YbcI (DUF457 family)